MPAAYLARRIVNPVNGSSLPIKSRGLVICCSAEAGVPKSKSKVQVKRKVIEQIDLKEKIFDFGRIFDRIIGRKL
jgi:hypothetical protein